MIFIWQIIAIAYIYEGPSSLMGDHPDFPKITDTMKHVSRNTLNYIVEILILWW